MNVNCDLFRCLFLFTSGNYIYTPTPFVYSFRLFDFYSQKNAETLELD